jgi:hypothetical protein
MEDTKKNPVPAEDWLSRAIAAEATVAGLTSRIEQEIPA